MYIFIESCDRRGGPSLRTTTYRRFIFAEILFSFSTFLHNAKEAYVHTRIAALSDATLSIISRSKPECLAVMLKYKFIPGL